MQTRIDLAALLTLRLLTLTFEALFTDFNDMFKVDLLSVSPTAVI